jgi:hypothetical protein
MMYSRGEIILIVFVRVLLQKPSGQSDCEFLSHVISKSVGGQSELDTSPTIQISI